MKRYFVVCGLILLAFPANGLAQSVPGDLFIVPENVRFSTATFIEAIPLRIYATVSSKSNQDLRGVVKFFDNNKQIQTDQPISVLAGKDDAVYVDWTPDDGTRTIKIVIMPFNSKDADISNNTFKKTVIVLTDTDRDGIPNIKDDDDDNDGVPDAKDAFPLNKKEWVDSDGDGIGNNQDDDDDNDGVKDTLDRFPLNALEWLDTDGDGIGDNEDTDDDGDGLTDLEELKRGTNPLKKDTDGDGVNDKEDAYPLDPTRSRDFDKDGIPDEKDKDADNDGIPKGKDVNDTNRGPQIKVQTYVVTAGSSSSGGGGGSSVQNPPPTQQKASSTSAESKASPPSETSPQYAMQVAASVSSDGTDRESSEQKSKLIFFKGQTVVFDASKSIDSDGENVRTTWDIDGKKLSGSQVQTTLEKYGFHKVAVVVTDDKGESRTENFEILALPRGTPWILTGGILMLLIFAIFFIVSYSVPSRSGWHKLDEMLRFMLKFIPQKKK